MKLLIRGGSIAAGHGVAESYADIVTGYFLGKGIEVINRSRFKETSFDGIGTFAEDIESFTPDILLVQFGVDDAFGYVYRSEFQENIVQMIRLARLRFNPAIYLATSHTFDNCHDMDAVNIFYKSLSFVAAELGCQLIPVHSYWAGFLAKHNMSARDLVLSDSRYPNERGHQVMAEAIIRYLGTDKLIQAGCGKRKSRV